jgi:hypothetical protein
MKVKCGLIGMFALVTLAVAAPHTWVLKMGGTVAGDYVSSGTTKLVVKTDGTNCFLNISDLSTKDWLYLYECKTNQRQMQLNAEAAQMRAAGQMEFTADFIQNFPEKVRAKEGWMDITFSRFDKYAGRGSEMDLGFDVIDKSGNYFDQCCVCRNIYGENFLNDPNAIKPNPLVDVVANLKPGDKVRLFGCVGDDNNFGDKRTPTSYFIADKIEMIESAADADAVKKAKEQLDAAVP